MLNNRTTIWSYYFGFANFVKLSLRVLPALFMLMGFSLIVGLHKGLISSPKDYQMGDVVRIMYVHIPTVYGAMFCYVVLFICSVAVVLKDNDLAYISARAIAPIGFVLATLGLFSGGVWGYYTWGTWWVWDARLTSFLVLWALYLGYLVCNFIADRANKKSLFSSWLILIGFVNVPIVKFSVNWWATLHQPPSLFRSGGVAINSQMLSALLWMSGFVTLFVLSVFILRLNGWYGLYNRREYIK